MSEKLVSEKISRQALTIPSQRRFTLLAGLLREESIIILLYKPSTTASLKGHIMYKKQQFAHLQELVEAP